MTDTYRENIRRGEEYQDFITDRLLHEGIFIGTYASRKWQYERGESASGIEIKFDDRLHATGNLYFEYAEKSNATNTGYVHSGIMREDNSWAYLIGDYNEAFLFGKKQLANLLIMPKEKQRSLGMTMRQTPTSLGFTIPREQVFPWLCLKHFVFT